MIVFLTDIKGIVALSSFVTPILVLGILGAGFYVIVNMDAWVFSPVPGFDAITDNWLVSVMCSLLPYLKSRKIAAAGGIIGGLALSFIAIVLNIILYVFYPDIVSEEIPVLSIIGRHNFILGEFYKILLLLAIFISAVTSGYGFIERIANKVRISRKILIPVICGFVVPISNVGFSGLISSVYPAFGYVGMFMLFMILIQGLNMLLLLFPARGSTKTRNNIYDTIFLYLSKDAATFEQNEHTSIFRTCDHSCVYGCCCLSQQQGYRH